MQVRTLCTLQQFELEFAEKKLARKKLGKSQVGDSLAIWAIFSTKKNIVRKKLKENLWSGNS